MVDSISSSGPLQNAQGLTPPSKPAGTQPPGAPSGPAPANTSSGTSAAQNVDLSGFIDSDLTNDQALTQSQTAGQQLGGTGLSIANRSPQALANALPN